MTVSFVRQLGAEPGVQLNPLRDASGSPTADNSDQIFGIVMRSTRGRIDKPFVVDRSNVYKKLGTGEQIRVNALNEAWVHVVEALNNGAYEAVVQRLVSENAKIKYIVCRYNEPTETVDPSEGDSEGGDDADDSAQDTTEEPAVEVRPEFSFTVEDELPADKYLFAIRHLECFNDGIQVSFHVDEKTENGVEIENNEVVLRISDCDGDKLAEYRGSLDITAKDDYGSPYYLPDVIASQTDTLEVSIGMGEDGFAFLPTSSAYGYTENGSQAWVESDTLVAFDEGGTDYQTSDYLRSREALQYSDQNYAYISSGGTRSPALLYQLAQLAFDTNRQLRFDIPGELEPEAAIAFLEQLNLSASKCAHLMQAFWAPLKADDPTGINPKGYVGLATLNIAFACGRNAQKNSKGFAPKNYPIAGKDWPVNRTGLIQTYTLTNQEKSKLANAKINPVVFDVFTSGGLYIYQDSLTCAPVTNSARKLISVADMSTDIDDKVTRACKDFLQLPMKIALARIYDYLQNLFTAAEASDWLVPSSDPSMGGAAWKFEAKPNEINPFDQVDVSYWLRYDGAVRQIFVTQTITK